MKTESEPEVFSFEAEDRLTRDLMRDLHVVRPAFYWVDLLGTALTGWTAFALAVILQPLSPEMIAASVVAVILLYRGLGFIHEISHQTGRSLPRFESAWNVLIGFFLLLPSCVYAGVHQDHHRLSTYGTGLDPEYLPFSSNGAMTLVFAMQSFLIPFALLARFLILSPLGMLSEHFENWLVVYASSLTMNIAYRRQATPELKRSVRRQSAGILLVWVAAIAVLPWRTFAVWLAVHACISFVNTLRTLGAHAYESAGEPLDRASQLADSIDTPGAPWTEIWAPVGLRYHALHHYFPGIPYHNLGKAWSRLATELPAEARYHKARSRGLRYSLRALLRKGFGARREP